MSAGDHAATDHRPRLFDGGKDALAVASAGRRSRRLAGDPERQIVAEDQMPVGSEGAGKTHEQWRVAIRPRPVRQNNRVSAFVLVRDVEDAADEGTLERLFHK